MKLGKWIVVFCCALIAVGAQESGRLANKLEYYLQHNEVPKGRAAILLAVKTGMIHESEHELGLAHLVEHLVWRGTKNLNAQQIIDEAALIGGKDELVQIGAVTGMEAVYFHLNVDATKPQVVERALLLLKNLASSAVMPPEALDAEKKGVLQELHDKMEEPNLLKLESQLTMLLQKPTRFFTQGVVEATQKATPKALQDFYQAKYHPDQMVLIAVGDFDESALKKRVEDHFGSMENPPISTAEPKPSMPLEPRTSRMFYKHDAFKLPQVSVAYLLPLGRQDPGLLLGGMRHELQQLVEGGSVLSSWTHRIVVSESYQLLEAGVVLFDTSSIMGFMEWFEDFAHRVEQSELGQPQLSPLTRPLENETWARAWVQQFLHPHEERLSPIALKNCPKVITAAYSQDP
jgi:hypothetical protein